VAFGELKRFSVPRRKPSQDSVAIAAPVCLSTIQKDPGGNELYCSANSLLQCPLPCSHFSSHWVRSCGRALTSSSRSWLYPIKSESSSARLISAPDSPPPMVSSGSRSPAIGVRRCSSSSRKRLWPGIARASAYFGVGKSDTDNHGQQGRRPPKSLLVRPSRTVYVP
jgi:hypothetical protein